MPPRRPLSTWMRRTGSRSCPASATGSRNRRQTSSRPGYWRIWRPTRTSVRQVRIASFNLQHGRSLHDGQVLPERLQEAVQLLAADVLGLQEVDSNQPRSDGRHLTQEVAEHMGAADWKFVPALVGTPGVQWRHAHDDDHGAD